MGAVISRVAGPLVEVRDAGDVAMFEMFSLGDHGLPAETVAIKGDVVTVQAYEYTGSLAPGDRATPLGHPLSVDLGPHLLGHVFDGLLRPLTTAPTWLIPGATGGTTEPTPEPTSPDVEGGPAWWFEPAVDDGTEVTPGTLLGVARGEGPVECRILVPPGLTGTVWSITPAGAYPASATLATVAGRPIGLVTAWPIRRPRPVQRRVEEAEPLRSGQRVLDLLFPVARGGTAAVPGGFGTGKTVLLQQLAKWCDADVIVYVGCGERGNEMAEVVAELLALTDPRTGGRLADRTVIIANTSNMPMMAREASIYTGVTVAEYFRDMGYHTVVIADSTSRWAEALREFGSRTGALPAEEGYPAELASALAAFYERAGVVDTLGGTRGSVTIVGAVSPPGGDFTEPVTAHTERFVRCLWTLDRDLAYARHYPAVSWSASFSRDAEALAAYHRHTGDPDWLTRLARVRSLLAEADRLSALIELVGVSALPDEERVVVLGGRLVREAVLQQSALSANDAFCSEQKTAALVEAVLAVVDRCRELVASGVPAATVEEVDFGPLVRTRDETGPTDADGVGAHLRAMLDILGALA